MTELELAYLAGIIDGEGCLSLAWRKGRTTGPEYRYVTPTIQITNTHLPLLEWVYSSFGGNIYQRKDTRPNRKDSWLWSVAGHKAKNIVQLTYPFLKIKVAQADLILALHRTTEITRDSKGRLSNTLTTEQHQRNHLALEQIRALNKRGR